MTARRPRPLSYKPDRFDYEHGWRMYADACEVLALADADTRFGPLASDFTGCMGDGDPRGTVHGRFTEGPGSLWTAASRGRARSWTVARSRTSATSSGTRTRQARSRHGGLCARPMAGGT